MKKNVTENENIIDKEPEEIILTVIAAVIGGILLAIKNLVKWICDEIEWDFIKNVFIFLLAVSIPTCIASMVTYNMLRDYYPHCDTMCIKYASDAMECLNKCKGEKIDKPDVETQKVEARTVNKN